ncbi:hypothetical protein T484DRAFT_1815345 [Baffinella frigidus]|nr:hypothetical protein T484DRAFT_1815345 [Cryptophyta sp. CCMP2293]
MSLNTSTITSYASGNTARFADFTSNKTFLFLDATAVSSPVASAFAIRAGVPTVTSPGRSAHSRTGAAMLLPPTAPAWLAVTLARSPADFINNQFQWRGASPGPRAGAALS